jgi:Domain of unknown function (DUF4412)
MPGRLLVATFVAALAASPAWAGVTLVWDHVDEDGQRGEVRTHLDPERLRMESDEGALIYRADRKVAWFVDDQERSYTEMTAEQGRAAQRALQDMQAQMRQQMSSLPEAQRRQMEEMLARQGGPGAASAPKSTYRKVASDKTVGSWRCDEWEELVGGRRESLFCWARLGALGLAATDLKPLLSLQKESGVAEFGRALGAASDYDEVTKAVGYEGLPLRAVQYSEGKEAGETVLKRIERGTLPATLFEIPAGYKKESMGLPGR